MHQEQLWREITDRIWRQVVQQRQLYTFGIAGKSSGHAERFNFNSRTASIITRLADSGKEKSGVCPSVCPNLAVQILEPIYDGSTRRCQRTFRSFSPRTDSVTLAFYSENLLTLAIFQD